MSIYHPIKNFLDAIEGESAPFRQEVLRDYWVCLVSREVSLAGRKEVLGGKAKFGILGDGKELPQVAMARAFENGDFRSGYYRDQTFMFALDLCSVEDYFAQLYADPVHDPFSGGRQMNAHFATPLVDADSQWINHTTRYNVSADISPTSGQMARALGLALASKHYRQNESLGDYSSLFSRQGREVSFVTIGDASTSEGVFWETMNAAAVQQVPLAVFVWDDGYGISVPIELQTVKQNISSALAGFEKEENTNGILIYKLKAWDYAGLVNGIQEGISRCRTDHVPVLFHVQEVTQPQGHSTSGSHERYKSKDRLEWESDQDCIKMFQSWILENDLLSADLIDQLQKTAKDYVRQQRSKAWARSLEYPQKQLTVLKNILQSMPEDLVSDARVDSVLKTTEPMIHECLAIARQLQTQWTAQGRHEEAAALNVWISDVIRQAQTDYHANLIAEGNAHYNAIPMVGPQWEGSQEMNGYQVINKYFEQLFENNPEVLAFGEDVGKIGDVNQGFAGLQERFGELRVFDTGIREWTIVGQAIGLSMRGLRPIAELQYLDYVIYALSALADDLATVRYRSDGIQQAPAIIRTRGHRLEGIWHSGSPIGMLLHSLRGIHLCVPRNFTIAAGMYNTLMASKDPGIVIECLNGYRLKENCPVNLTTYTVPLGVVEVMRRGSDLSLVTYGSTVRIAQKACEVLAAMNIEVELIDVQTLLPFDDAHDIAKSLRKTNKLVIVDEDVPGGASAYILQQVLQVQGAYQHLDTPPICISSHEHRPPYGSDGDYFSKPSCEDIVEAIHKMMSEYHPAQHKF